MKQFIQDGQDQLIVITDFDYTLTPCVKDDGKHGLSSHGILETSDILSESIRKVFVDLFEHYYPLEISPTLSMQEKESIVVDWWTKTHEALIDYRLTKQQLHYATNHTNLTFRDGFQPLFEKLAQKDVPVLIFSAGLADVIREVLLDKMGAGFMTPNMHIVSNLMKFDKNGILVGFEGNILHSFNKNAGILKGTEFYQQCDQRHNVLLIGDSLGDANMAEGLHYKNILRVGYLNAHQDERMEQYMDKFDVIVLGDGSLQPIQSFVDLVTE